VLAVLLHRAVAVLVVQQMVVRVEVAHASWPSVAAPIVYVAMKAGVTTDTRTTKL